MKNTFTNLLVALLFSFISTNAQAQFTSGTYNAKFTKNSVTPTTYTITVSASPAIGGTATVNKGSSATVEENGSVELSATPNSGYTFVNWTNGDKEITTQAQYTINNITADAEYVANFQQNQVAPAVDTDCNIASDNTMRYYRLAIAIDRDSYTTDFESNYNNVKQFWQDCEDFMNEMYVPLGMCFDAVVNESLIMSTTLPINSYNGIPEIGGVTTSIDNAIGSSAYDVGIWVVHREDSDENTGLSNSEGAYNSTTKANGYAKADKWVVAHEIGHLFGADHTTTGEGSLMDNAGEFFSYPSIKKIRDASVKYGSGNAYKSEVVANNAPTFTSQMKDTYRIPQGAFLAIPVYASDADGHSLRYTAIGCSSSTVGNIVEGGTMPHFYSFKPQTSNLIEYSPQYTADIIYDTDFYIVEGTDIAAMNEGTYSIAILVNDMPTANSYDYLTSNPFYSNYAVWDANVEIVSGTPFTASVSPSQNSYTAGQTVTVSWGVNESYFSSSSRVRITMSTDYGKTFNYVLADDVPALDGSKAVTLPNVNVSNVDVDFTTATRSMRGGIIRVEEVGGAAYTLTTTTPENGGGFTVSGGSSETTYTISVKTDEGGTVSIDGNTSATVVAGSSVTLTATPAEGYRFDGWYKDGVWVNDEPDYTFTPVASGTYNAVFVKEAGATTQYTITVAANPATSGTATVNGAASATVEANGSVELLAIPEKGYEFVNWTNGDKEIATQAQYTINNITADANYVANFKEESSGSDPEPSTGLGGKWYRIKDNASGKYIDINKNGTTENSHGNVIMSDKDENSERQIIYFETSGDGYKLKAATGDYIKCEQWNVSAGDASEAATLLFEETGDYYYIKWHHTTYYETRYFKVETAKGGDGALHPYDDAGSKEAAAIWTLEEVKYTVSVSANEGGTAEVSTGGGEGAASVEVSYDGSATLTATPTSGYTFVKWTKDGNLVSEASEYTVNNIKADVEYVANFEQEAGTIDPEPEFPSELDGHWFCIREKDTDLYMNIANNYDNTDETSGVTVAAKATDGTNQDGDYESDRQVFEFQKSGDGYKLKSKGLHYIGINGSNVNASSIKEGTELTLEYTGEGTEYRIAYKSDYFNTRDVDVVTYVFSNEQTAANATVWVLEEVEGYNFSDNYKELRKKIRGV